MICNYSTTRSDSKFRSITMTSGTIIPNNNNNNFLKKKKKKKKKEEEELECSRVVVGNQ
jgi:hypothetical protein